VVRGTRIAVGLVLEELAHNPDIVELLAAHPDLTRPDVQACVAYAKAMVTGEEVSRTASLTRRFWPSHATSGGSWWWPMSNRLANRVVKTQCLRAGLLNCSVSLVWGDGACVRRAQYQQQPRSLSLLIV
jgi:hypothetical protein